MGKYSSPLDGEAKVAKSRGSHLRVHFKHCREITHHIHGMSTTKAKKFMNEVLEFMNFLQGKL